jgi:hypothetical protein
LFWKHCFSMHLSLHAGWCLIHIKE